MKKIILLLLLIVASFQGFSQTPGISYQAVILNPNTKELPGANAQTSILENRNVVVRFTIINDSNNQEYQEYHQTKTDAYGMINLLIGHGTRTGSSYFEDVVWNGFSKKLKIEIDFSGNATNFTPLSEQELTFMPQPALGQDAQAIVDNTASILAEITRATNAESVIQADVDTNEAASILADMTLQTKIDNVQEDIDAIEASTTAAIATVQTDVDANEAASILGDATLQSNIDNVQTDVDANETATQIALDLKANLDSPIFMGTVSGIDKGMVGLGDVDNTSDANKPVSIATQTALDLKVDKVSGKGLSTEDYTTAEKTKLGAITGSNTGDQDISGIATNMTNIGDLTSLTTTNKLSVVAAINEIEIEKADLESPTLTGTPLSPTATAGTNTTQIATTAFVNNAVNTATTGNFVDLTTNQTIAGVKTFSGDIIVNGIDIGRGVGDNDQNTAVGRSALGTGTGTRNTAIGYAALKDYAGTSFDNNTSVGYFNMPSLTTGDGNTSVGAESMLSLLTGSSNTSIGNQSLISVLGNNNVGVGKRSGDVITTGSNNTILGTEANVLVNNQTNSTAVGFQAVAASSNTIQLGNTNVTLVNTSGAITSGGAITGISIVKVGGTSSEYLMADGSVSTGTAPVREVADEFSATASQTSFTLTQTPSVNSKVKMYVNGIRISNAAYNVTGTTLTYDPVYNGGNDLTAGDRIQMDFYY